MKVMWSVPTDDYWNEVRRRRRRPSLSPVPRDPGPADARDGRRSFAQFADHLDLSDIETTEFEMNRSLWFLQRPQGQGRLGHRQGPRG